MAFYNRMNPLDQWNLRFRSAFHIPQSAPNRLPPALMVAPATEFWLVLSGEKTIEIDSKPYLLHKGCLTAFPPETKIVFTHSTEPFHYLHLACYATIGAFELIDMFQIPLVTVIEELDEHSPIVHTWLSFIHQADDLIKSLPPMHILDELTSSHPDLSMDQTLETAQSIRYLYFHNQLSYLIIQILELISHALPSRMLSIDLRIQQACDYIGSHLSEPLEINDLAKHIFISPSHLRHLFHQSLNMTPSAYIRKARLQRARELLMITDRSITEISEMVGLENTRRFSRVFTHAMGISPHKYRQISKSMSIYPVGRE